MEVGPKDVERLAEDVVVDQPGEDAEESHGRDDVPAPEIEDPKDLAVLSHLGKLALHSDHPDC